MKKNGFTLIELIGVLTLLALVALIALPSVDRVIKNSRKGALTALSKSLSTSTRSWVTDNKDLFIKSGDTITITLLDLKEAGLVEPGVLNPVTQVCLSNDNTISVTWVKDLDNNKYDIVVADPLVDGTEEDCNVTSSNAPKIFLVGGNTVDIPFNSDITKLSENINGSDTDGIDVIAKSSNGDDITSTVTVTYSFDTGTTKVLQKGLVTYSVTNSGFTKNVNRMVNIVDTVAPILLGVKESVVIDKTVTTYNLLEGVSASDNYDGNLTSSIIAKSNIKLGEVGTYYVTYSVKDSSGNIDTKTTTVTIKN